MQEKTDTRTMTINGILMLREMEREWGTTMMVTGVWIFLSQRRNLFIGVFPYYVTGGMHRGGFPGVIPSLTSVADKWGI